MIKWYKTYLAGLIILSTFLPILSQQDSVLMFVSYDSTYYSEYIVMYEALVASGYFVDVRSAGVGTANTYLIGGDLVAQANGLSGSSYAAFETQFQNIFGNTWNVSLNNDPGSIPISDSIQNVESMAPYRALIVVGGRGVVDYRIDGSYDSQLSLPASQVESAAIKLNSLAVEALATGKPVMGQCHGASIPAYWRVPNTLGNGPDNLGNSLLEGSIATGYPEPATGTNLGSLNINFRANDKVVIGTPHNSLDDNGAGEYKIVTTRDWYPQTVAHAAKTLRNIIETYPPVEEMQNPVSVLIIHGGVVDETNCGAGNRNNDIPCNYGSDASNLPADYTDLVSLFNSNQFSDDYNFVVAEINIADNPPFNLNNQSEIENYLRAFDVIFFYKHWSDFVSVELQNAIVSFADDGGGVVSNHHGLYNDIHNGFNKNILVNNLFEAESPQAGWSASRIDYQIFQTNYGHFVSSFGIVNDDVAVAPAAWTGSPNLPGSNLSLSLYQQFGLFDEIYNNMQFIGGVNFGENINEITPLFSNDQMGQQCHVHGFVKRFNANEDEKIGKIVYGQAGETKENYQYPHPYAQFLRNAVIWSKKENICSLNNPIWNAGNGNWDTAENWTTMIVPNQCSEVIIPNQMSETTVTISSDTEITIQLLEIGLNVIFSVPLGATLTVLAGS